MNEMGITIVVILATVGTYILSRKFYQKYPSPITNPLLIGTFLLILLLVGSGTSYETYMIGGKWIEHLLGPAVVALAFPLYKNRKILTKYLLPLCCGVTIGAFLGIISGAGLSKLLGIEDLLIYSLIPKSVTTPVAMEVAATLGGIPALAALFVMIAGIGGAIFGPVLLKFLKVTHFLGIGVGLGSAAHAIGTSRAHEFGELEGAISTVSMTLSAVIVSFLGPILFYVFY
ncbi:LrgB family protein [Anaerobacillus alkaliphilus]|uniref:LrgB family protein n=1 Tax=Anaerobacillus alkaliphilus TaxID=1548597 RepID=A0A4Q0VR69_9BACI|nr:LrgB family protein [Anaerobacillus alkaliphilus]RXI98631.1 LrgB family protein [Anaerobacillus alkaliphilus]